MIGKMEYIVFLTILIFSGKFVIPCECKPELPDSVSIARLQTARFDKKGIAFVVILSHDKTEIPLALQFLLSIGKFVFLWFSICTSHFLQTLFQK